MNKSKNRGVVYAGKVGRKLRPLTRGMFSSKRVIKLACLCCGGPMDGHTLYLSAHCGFDTLPFVHRGLAGRYVNGQWQAAAHG